MEFKDRLQALEALGSAPPGPLDRPQKASVDEVLARAAEMLDAAENRVKTAEVRARQVEERVAELLRATEVRAQAAEARARQIEERAAAQAKALDERFKRVRAGTADQAGWGHADPHTSAH